MPIDIVLNEHSLHAPDDNTARDWLIQLVKTIQAASKKAASEGFNATVNLWRPAGVEHDNLVGGSTYTLMDFVKSPGPNHSLRMYLLALLNKNQCWDVHPVPHNTRAAHGITMIHFTHPGGRHSVCLMCGLGFAYLRDGLAVSLPSKSCWNNNSITLKVTASNGVGSHTVCHASDSSHI